MALYVKTFKNNEPVTLTTPTRRHGIVHLIKATLSGPDTVVAQYGSYNSRFKRNTPHVRN